MRKFFTLVPVITLLALAAPVGQAQPMPGPDQMHKRFEQMDRMVDQARKSRGAERWRHMQDHMAMMRDQMMAMHGMMGSGMMGGGNMGNGTPGMGMNGGPMGAVPNQWMQRMQNRMDMMQGMMEQMQKQQELMMEDRPKQ